MKNTLESLAGSRWFPYAALAAAAVLIYGRTLFFGFTWLDDDGLILNNLPFLTDLSNIPAAFAREAFDNTGGSAYYRPLLTLSLMWDAALGGSLPFFYHLTNLCLHAGAVMALYALLRALGRGAGFSLAAGLVFCAHPLLSQAVAWVPGRNDLLLAVFVLLSFKAFLKFLDGGKGALTAHLLLYACALFTKESAVMLPPLLALYALWVKPPAVNWQALRRPALGWLVLTALWIPARAAALHTFLPGGDLSSARAFWHNLPALLTYLGKALFPVNLSTMPVAADMSLLPGAVALALLCAALYYGRAAAREAAFGSLWFALWLLPSFARPGRFTDFSEHRIYVAFIGLLFLAGAIKITRPRAAVISAAVLIPLLGGLSVSRLGVFSGRLGFWENAAATSPSSVIARTKLGAAYYEAGLYPPARAQWEAALKLEPGDAMLLVNMGSLSYAEGRAAEAAALWTRALAEDPVNKKALNNLAILYFEEKNYVKAAVFVEKLLLLGASVHPALLSSTARYRGAI